MLIIPFFSIVEFIEKEKRKKLRYLKDRPISNALNIFTILFINSK